MAGASTSSITNGHESPTKPVPCPTTSPPLNKVNFFGSQIGDQTVINYSYTDDPWRLMVWDTFYFFYYIWALPYILLPYRPNDSGELSELAPTRGNIFCILIHVVLVIFQLGFILLLPPLALFLPLWATLLIIAAFLVLNTAISSLLNGEDTIFHSDPKYAAPDQDRFAHEQWVFLNGVAVGSHWMKSNLDRLALTFGRPVVGIHNRTSGILFDVIECLIQRNFGYATKDVRMCYPILKEKLYDPRYSKVVFIMHSQGGIEGGLVLDWLLQELPQNLLSKLEVYTFGNAANHFNNPYRTVGSQARTEERPLAVGGGAGAVGLASTEFMNGNENVNAKGHGVVGIYQVPRGLEDRPLTPGSPPPILDTTTTHKDAYRQHAAAAQPATTRSQQSSRPSSSVRAIRHIEHYAFNTDFVALWGVLHFATSRPASRTIPRFLGRLFVRASPDNRGGHQFVQHYLDGMFPLERDPVTGAFVGCREYGNAFMESEVEIHGGGGGGIGDGQRSADGGGSRREGVAGCCEGTGDSESEGDGENGGFVEMHNGGGSPVVLRRKRTGQTSPDRVKVKELSRLWKYRNGKSPVDRPPLLEKGLDGVVRGATM